VAVEILVGSVTGEVGSAAIASERIAVPAHFDVEVYAALRRIFRRGLVDRTRLDRSVSLLAALAAERVALPPLLPEAHRLADRVSVPDAFYVALARVRDSELLTTDLRLAEAADGFARVQLIRSA
jgi:predicted nucleic acid-binding protein